MRKQMESKGEEPKTERREDGSSPIRAMAARWAMGSASKREARERTESRRWVKESKRRTMASSVTGMAPTASKRR
jgi:hypothetical protein